jgi:hypothetical protein
MAITVTSPITGAAQTGLTSPTYTVASDNAPPGDPGEQVAVTALGGTQTGVTSHSISSPFTILFTRPANPKIIGTPNPVTGQIANVPNNRTRIVTRKGVTPAVNQQPRLMTIRTEIDVPAGSDTYDAANVRAALSAHFGAIAQQSAGIGDTVVSALL